MHLPDSKYVCLRFKGRILVFDIQKCHSSFTGYEHNKEAIQLNIKPELPLSFSKFPLSRKSLVCLQITMQMFLKAPMQCQVFLNFKKIIKELLDQVCMKLVSFKSLSIHSHGFVNLLKVYICVILVKIQPLR